jgi:hypothetical protein
MFRGEKINYFDSMIVDEGYNDTNTCIVYNMEMKDYFIELNDLFSIISCDKNQ